MTKEIVRAADLTLRIFEIVAFSHEPIGVTQVAQAAGIAKSAAFKHLTTLAERSYVIQDAESARYRPGPKMQLLARMVQAPDDLMTLAEPFMTETRNRTGLSVVLSAPMDGKAIVLATLHNGQPVEIGVRPGSALTLHASAQGKVILAFGPEGNGSLTGGAALPGLTPRTITDPAVLRAEIARIRHQGYAEAPEETLLGVNTIAAPIFDHRGELAGCVGLVGSIQHLTTPAHDGHCTAIVGLAGRISRALGAVAQGG